MKYIEWIVGMLQWTRPRSYLHNTAHLLETIMVFKIFWLVTRRLDLNCNETILRIAEH